ncbi:MAG TPA: DNA-directed RNA polymerase subunit beta' [Solirubrobacterales bacterium]|nr:DNA-directed RNA polymerase subunit beta' [Solirubrobacterales bacterium]
MIDINNFDAIEIGLASGKKIRGWSSGEVTKPETINYRTLKPEKDGLFCERIFGPTKDWECYCGKYKRVRYKGIVCERCGVEVTRSKVRRERMGHVDLAAPVSHIWFFKGVPSRIGYLIDMAPKELEKVLYFAASVITWVDEEARSKDLGKLEKEVEKQAGEYEREREQRSQELNEALVRRLAYLGVAAEKDAEAPPAGTTDGFNDDDELWADSVTNVKRMKAEDRDKMAKELRKTFDAEISDTEAYLDEAAERIREVFKIFSEMKPKDVINDETTFRELKDRFGSPFGWGEYFRGGMGAESIRDLLEQVELENEAELLEETINTSKGQKQSRAVKRLKVVDAFLKSANKPEWMVLDVVPVIPPELRPMVQLDGGRFATSDLNDLYRRVINRNNRLKRLLDLGAPEIIVNNEKRMLQEAVDALFDNGRRGRPVTGPGNRPLKSLSDMLKGKQGRFRQNLLGKRVDYSGRSVIVSGPSLRLHQCGLPKLMALELFKPFIMARLVERKQVQNIKAAKKMVDSMIPEVWDVLEEVIHEHPVLLNRAPTLHRLGIQAFEPVLVEGKAIQVHPLVCHAFNADFDGDQMAVHLPLSAEAQAEARILMLSSNNILSPAHGAPLATPTQDMVLGLYYLTYAGDDVKTLDRAELDQKPHPFRTAQEAELAYENGIVQLHDYAEYRRPGHEHFLTTVGRIIYNDRVERAIAEALGDEYDPDRYEFINDSLKKRDVNDIVSQLVENYGAPAVSLVLDSFKDLGFHFASEAGITISKNDVVAPPDKEEILERYESKTEEIMGQYDDGYITAEERKEAVTSQWDSATEEVGQAMEDNLDELNPIFMMANSGARGSFKQIRQLAGMRGLMANPKGEIIERPIKANFMEGLSVLEYFISTHGARKGLADTALRTADSGYLTRRLVDVSQDVIVRLDDCKTKDHIEMPIYRDAGEVNPNLLGRVAAKKFTTKRGRDLLKRNQLIEKAEVAELEEAFADDQDATVPVRSVLKCEAESGVCRQCYGVMPATGFLVEIGDAVGIIAAQSIGEPGTQLTMRTFHTGGVAGLDITQGLPRVVELFEARKPKGLAKLAEVAGKVTVEETDKAVKLTITDDKGEEYAESFPPRTNILVEAGKRVERGDQLNEGSLYPAEILEIKGRTDTEVYIVAEVQRVYRTQGVDINDKHIELIVRQMLKKVRVESKGSTELLPGQLEDRLVFDAINEKFKGKKTKTPAKAEEVILGITKASLATESFLSAASFQETTKVLTDAALEGKRDRLMGLKENVIIGKLIPAATGLKHYRSLQIEPVEPAQPPVEEFSEEELAKELDLAGDGEGAGSQMEGFGPSFAEELEELASEIETPGAPAEAEKSESESS